MFDKFTSQGTSVHIRSLEELRSWVYHLSQNLDAKVCILLSGPMGVGKTQFVKYFVESLGSHEACSPTFAIHNVYKLENHRVDHIDLYRLEDEADLESTGFWDLFEQDAGYIIIEWADRMEERFLPKSWPRLRVSMRWINDRERKVSMEFTGGDKSYDLSDGILGD